MRKTTVAVTAGVMAFTVAGAFLTLSAAPVFAQTGDGVFIQWTSPDDGQKVSGKNFHIKAKIGFSDGVKSYRVEVLVPPAVNPPRPGYGTVCEEELGGSPSSATIDCVWDTTAYPDQAAAYNGRYLVRVTAVNATPMTKATARSRTFPRMRKSRNPLSISVLLVVAPG